MNKLLLAVVLLAAPLAARADVGLRIGPEITIANHDQGGTHFITDYWPVAGDVMLSYWTPGQLLSIDLELAEQFILNAPNCGSGVSTTCPGSRLGTLLRPGIRVSPPVLPVYLRAAIPISIEAPAPYSSGQYGLRLGAGINIPLVLFKVYLEADADFPLGGNNSPSAFSNWALVANGGLDFRF